MWLLIALSIAHARPARHYDAAIMAAAAASNTAARYFVVQPGTPDLTQKLHREYGNEIECARSVFAVVDHDVTQDVIARYAVISSFPYTVDTLEKRGSTDLIRISYQWPDGPGGGPAPINPVFSTRVNLDLAPYHPRKIWTEYFSKYCY